MAADVDSNKEGEGQLLLAILSSFLVRNGKSTYGLLLSPLSVRVTGFKLISIPKLGRNLHATKLLL